MVRMASIEAMTKEAARSLKIRVKRLNAANAELEAAQDMDRRAVARLDAAENAQKALNTEVTEKADLVSRLTGKPAAEVLDEIRAELTPADDENAETDPAASGDAPADSNPDGGTPEADVKPAKKAPAKKTASVPATV
jgi:aminoglycoside phosphotransferase